MTAWLKPHRRRRNVMVHNTRDAARASIGERIAERDARNAFVPSLDHVLMGTPPPGRSAYDKWEQQGEPERKIREV